MPDPTSPLITSLSEQTWQIRLSLLCSWYKTTIKSGQSKHLLRRCRTFYYTACLIVKSRLTMILEVFTARKRIWGEGNVFIFMSVCHSVQGERRVPMWQLSKWAVRIILQCFLVKLSLLNRLLFVALVGSVTLVVALDILPQNFGKVAATYEWYFLILWM